MIRKFIFFFMAFVSLISTAWADTGASLTIPVITKDPEHLHGYRASVWYQPQSWIWQHLHIFFDASFGHWWVSSNVPYREVNIFAVAPVFRIFTKQYALFSTPISPFADLSIGLSYLSKTRLDSQNLGMHFAFQDQVGIGVVLGKEQRLSISISALHYSNGSMCKKNAGITVPLLVNVGYRF